MRQLRRRGVRIAASVLGAGVLLATGFATGAFAGTPRTHRSTKTPITIGGTLGITGAFSEPSAEYRAVYQLWQSQINAHGGLLGHPVRITILNDNSQPSTAAAEYQTLISQDHVDFLLAPYTTYVGAPIVPIAKAAGKILFNGGFVGVQYFNQDNGWMVGSYTYQEPDYPLGVFRLMQRMPASKRPKKIAILTAQNPFTIVAQNGYQGVGGALNFARQNHMKVVFDQEYPASTTDFTSTIEQAKASGAQALIVLGLPDDSDLIAKTVKVVGWRPMIECMCGSQVTTLPNWPSLGAATNGVLGTDVAWPTQHFPGMATLQAFARRRGERVMPNYDLTAYAILQMLQQGVVGTHSFNQAKIRAWLLSHVVHTVVGSFRLLRNGTPPFHEIVTQTVGSLQRPVWPPSVATARLVAPLP
ncbi:MAG TPA: ABC transporter substrate-binding protein [Acidimicrobiales bacterium]|nr:ABC transporter substrate-binding protein [Acidimicrobiales bacterium]